CDGKLPACSACERAGRADECFSPNEKYAKASERSYVASLESRIERLEQQIAFAGARKASIAMHDNNKGAKSPCPKNSFAAIRAAVQEKAAQKRETADVNELISDFGFLSVNATTRGFDVPSTKMTFARLILAASNNEPIPRYQPFRLPPRTATMPLLKYYLDTVFVLLPLFPEADLLTVFDAMYQENGQSVTDFEYWLFCMVLAIGSSGQSRSNKDKFYIDGVLWVGRALQFADRVLVPGFISQIQALALLVQYAMLDPVHFDSWILAGFACRAAIDLGFHQDPLNQDQTDLKVSNLRRAIFYYDSASVTIPSLASLTPPPNSKPVLSEPNILQVAIELFKLRLIQSSWYQELFQSGREPFSSSPTYVWEKCQEMQQWAQSLPKDLPSSLKLLLDLELSYSYVYCLAPSFRVKNVSARGKFLIFEHSIEYIEKNFKIAQMANNIIFYTYHDALRVFFVGSQFVSVLQDDQDWLLNTELHGARQDTENFLQSSLPQSYGIDNFGRSLGCISHIKKTLKIFGNRWEDSRVLLSSFEARVENLTKELYRKRISLKASCRT
ncbi:Bgt-1529, partial [Blumeria graminis f. sp. tritici]